MHQTPTCCSVCSGGAPGICQFVRHVTQNTYVPQLTEYAIRVGNANEASSVTHRLYTSFCGGFGGGLASGGTGSARLGMWSFVSRLMLMSQPSVVSEHLIRSPLLVAGFSSGFSQPAGGKMLMRKRPFIGCGMLYRRCVVTCACNSQQ